MTGCCACSGKPTATVHDGGRRKPVCEVHARLWGELGYMISRDER